MSAIPERWLEFLSSPWQIAGAAYVIIGLCVVGFVSFRGPRWRNPPTGGLLWEEKDNARNTLFQFLAIGKLHPIGVVIEILLWPVWLVLILVYYEK